MKNFITPLSVVFLFVSCNVSFNGDSLSGNGNIKKETRNVGNFKAIKSSGSIDIEISSGDTYSVSVEDDENILPVIVTDVDNGTLNIHYKNNTSINNDHAKVYIKAPSLEKIISSGSANISITDAIKNNHEIEIGISGSGNIEGGVDAPKISASIGGSGNMDLKGRTKDFEARVSGSGDLECGNLQSENTTVRVSGSGNAHVFASVHLTASVSGSGNVRYRGNPSSPEIHSSGSGSVEPE
ncbi:MAG: head GIN domain-containing protein [Ginsengibacter sp.]